MADLRVVPRHGRSGSNIEVLPKLGMPQVPPRNSNRGMPPDLDVGLGVQVRLELLLKHMA